MFEYDEATQLVLSKINSISIGQLINDKNCLQNTFRNITLELISKYEHIEISDILNNISPEVETWLQKMREKHSEEIKKKSKNWRVFYQRTINCLDLDACIINTGNDRIFIDPQNKTLLENYPLTSRLKIFAHALGYTNFNVSFVKFGTGN